MRVLVQSFDQNFLGLRIPAIGHVHVGFGNRVDLIGIDRSRTGLAEIAGLQRHVSGIHALATGRPEHGTRSEARWAGNGSDGLGCRFAATPPNKEIADQQRDDAAATNQGQGVEFLCWRRLWGNGHLGGLLNGLHFRRFGRLDRLRLFDRLGCFDSGDCRRRLRRFRRLNRLLRFNRRHRLRLFLVAGSLFLKFCQTLGLHVHQFLEFDDILLEQRQPLLRLGERLVLGDKVCFRS